ncbi:restriction endonuclease subunit S [uncultured Muribaculum sp.]|uniref:restriction endonuclease subunit S n=1 Tax=uncultured Muribaculum sp. TaxID=1918613 RepID=UPI00259CE092|nr:restriction endonuclease subunit S [uncultured Muribaculum sp.]
MERKMKDSGIPWIGAIPEHWEASKIGQLYDNRYVRVSDKDFEPLSVTMQGILPQLETAAKTDDGDNRKLVRKGDFAINSRSDRRGSCGISPRDGSVSLINLILAPRTSMNADYYNWLFHTTLFADEFYSWGHGIVADLWTTRWQEMKNIAIPVPPLAEQERIASYLDEECGEIDELIEVEQQMISDLESYRQAVITEAVTHGLNPVAQNKQSTIQGIKDIPSNWNEVNLLKVIYLRARLGWRGLKAEEYVDVGYPFLSAFNIVNNQLVWENLNFINQLRYDESPEIKLSLHDILIVKDGAGIGKCARVENMPLGESTVNSSLGVITVSETLYYSYLYYFFLSTPFQDNVLFLKNGMGVPHLTQENLKSVRIPLPPVDEQKTIANFLDSKCSEIDGLIKVKQEKIETLKQYRQSLIFEAVTGKTLITNNA